MFMTTLIKCHSVNYDILMLIWQPVTVSVFVMTTWHY